MATTQKRKLALDLKKKGAWKALTGDQQKILKMRFEDNKTRKEVAKAFAVRGEDIGEKRIERLEDKILRKLQDAQGE